MKVLPSNEEESTIITTKNINNNNKEENNNKDESKNSAVVDLSDLLYHVTQKPEKMLQNQKSSKEILLSTSQSLFTNILNSIQTLNNNSISNKSTSLQSSSDKLYYDASSDSNGEILWEQIDVLNKDVLTLFSKNMKKMKKSLKKDTIEDSIRLLDYEGESEDDEGGEMVRTDEDESSDDDDDDDSDTKRIKERMNRAMDDDDSEIEGTDDEEEGKSTEKKPKQIEEEEYDSDLDAAANVLNDGFFSIKAMEDFADEEEDFHDRSDETDNDNKGRHRSKEDVNLLVGMYGKGGLEEDEDDEEDEEEDEDDVDVSQMPASDFFGNPTDKYLEKKGNNKKQSVHWEEEEINEEMNDKEEDEDDDEGWPTIEQQKKAASVSNPKLDEQTSLLETSLLAEKPWQLTGEVKSSARPTNSLLDIMETQENTLQFEMAQKLAPKITPEHTQTLEQIIQQRILDEEWDDVIPRELPSILPARNSEDAPLVSQEKSKLSLGDLYERDYLKQNITSAETQEEESKEEYAKEGMRMAFGKLCSQLDALSNYHFAPRPIDAHDEDVELKHVTTAPALSVEEVIPIHVSDARQVTPEEVYQRNQGKEGILKGDTEYTRDEKKRLRQSSKAERRGQRKEKLQNEKLLSKLSTTSSALGFSNPYEKRKIAEDLNMLRADNKITKADSKDGHMDYTKSTTFFKRLEDEKSLKRSNAPDQNDDVGRRKKSTKIKL